MAKYFGLEGIGKSVGMSLLLLWVLSSPCFCKTTLLVDFDDGYDASFSVGEGAARFATELKEDDVKLVDGKFGKGVFIGRDVPALTLYYGCKDNFSYKEGALEFWFCPEWDLSFKREKEIASDKSGKWMSFILFSTGGDPTCFRLTKNQYNWLSFYYRIRYKTTAAVRTQYSTNSQVFQQGKWVHIAVSWDEDEARLFVNGGLVAVSDKWEVAGTVGDLVLGSKGYGKGSGAWGTFDDFRISDNKKYISSFPLPREPLRIEKDTKVFPSRLSEEEKKRFNERKTLFYIDFKNGLLANFSTGSPYGLSNRELKMEKIDGKEVARLQRYPDDPGDTLFFTLKDNLHPSLGTVEVTLQVSEENILPVVIFDASRVVLKKTNPADRYRRTGMRLILNEEACLEWQSIEDKKVISTVKSSPIELKKGKWYRFGFSWAGGTVSLYLNGKRIAMEESVALPSRLGKYFFICSDSQGQNSLDGWVDKVEILLSNKPAEILK